MSGHVTPPSTLSERGVRLLPNNLNEDRGMGTRESNPSFLCPHSLVCPAWETRSYSLFHTPRTGFSCSAAKIECPKVNLFRRGKEPEGAENRGANLCGLCSSGPNKFSDKKLGKAPTDSGRPTDWVLRNLRASLNLREVTLRSTTKRLDFQCSAVSSECACVSKRG